MPMHPIIARWNLLTGIATSLCTCIGGLLILPPLDYSSDYGRAAWSKFGVFAVTLLVGLWLIPIQLYSSRKSLKLWVAGAAFFVIAAVGAYFAYNTTLDRWAFPYAGGLVVAGPNLSPQAAQTRRDWIRLGRTVTNADLLWQYGGNIADVWPDLDERNHRTYLLLELYLADLLLMASAIVTVAQASYCAAAKPLKTEAHHETAPDLHPRRTIRRTPD